MKMWKRRFRARRPSNFSKFKLRKWHLNCQFHCVADASMIRGQPRQSRTSAGQASPHIFRDTFCPVKTKLSCETSLQIFVTSIALWHPLLCDSHCLVISIALWHPLLCDIHCFVTSIGLWHPLLCDIHCFVTSVAPWQPLHIHCHP